MVEELLKEKKHNHRILVIHLKFYRSRIACRLVKHH